MTDFGRLRQFDRCLASSINELCEQLGSYYETAKANPYRRPERIAVQPMRLTRMPDCPLCTANVNDCRCDPDHYAAAVYEMMNPEPRNMITGGMK